MSAGKNIALLLALACLLLAGRTTPAQSPTTGRIAGTVKDKRGTSIAAAEITVVSRAKREERKAIADRTGDYAVLLLPPGSYQVIIAAGGFKQTVFEDVQVNITQTTVVNADLEVGDLKESVTISTAPSLIQKDVHSVAGSLTRAQSQNCRWRRATLRRFWHYRQVHPSLCLTTPRWAATHRTSQ